MANYQKQVRQLIKTVAGNNTCVECDQVNPTWASTNLGVFLCLDCSGIHRSLGTHISKVKSTSLDKWDAKLVAAMKSIGNLKSRMYWEANMPSSVRRPSTMSQRNTFIRTKYVDKLYVSKKGIGTNSSNTLTKQAEAVPEIPKQREKKKRIPPSQRRKQQEQSQQAPIRQALPSSSPSKEVILSTTERITPSQRRKQQMQSQRAPIPQALPSSSPSKEVILSTTENLFSNLNVKIQPELQTPTVIGTVRESSSIEVNEKHELDSPLPNEHGNDLLTFEESVSENVYNLNGNNSPMHAPDGRNIVASPAANSNIETSNKLADYERELQRAGMIVQNANKALEAFLEARTRLLKTKLEIEQLYGHVDSIQTKGLDALCVSNDIHASNVQEVRNVRKSLNIEATNLLTTISNLHSGIVAELVHNSS